MASSTELKKARDAGRRAALTEPPERRTVDGCPFEPGTEERAEWLEAFASAFEEVPDPATIRKQVDEEISVNDKIKEARVR